MADDAHSQFLEGLRVTAEHPVETAPGIFRMASYLKPGDRVMVNENGSMVSLALSAVTAVRTGRPAYNLLVCPAGAYIAASIVVHNKGCFLPDTPVRRSDGTETPISAVRRGDRLLAFTADGRVTMATVRQVLAHEVDEYRVIRTATMVLQVTPEHPFYVGDGTSRTLEARRPGATIYAYDGYGLSPQRIESIDAVLAATRVYNLMTDAPHTFFANGIAVHNKGGGGCFAEGTPVLTPRAEVPIERVRPGDRVVAVDGTSTAPARVLDAAGIRTLVADGEGCCGAIRTHLNDIAGGLADMRRNIDAWWPLVSAGKVEAIVMNASGCGATVKDYGHALAHDPEYAQRARRIVELTRD